MTLSEVKAICDQTASLCHKHKFQDALHEWSKLKNGKEFYDYVKTDFNQFSNAKNPKIANQCIQSVTRDIDLVYPAIWNRIQHKPIIIHGIMHDV